MMSFVLRLKSENQMARGPSSYKKIGLCVCRLRRLRRPRRRFSNSVLMVVGVFEWRCFKQNGVKCMKKLLFFKHSVKVCQFF